MTCYLVTKLVFINGFLFRDMTRIFSKESMENHLSDEQKAVSLTFERTAERDLYQAVAYLRYSEHTDEIFEQFPKNFLGFWTPILKWKLKRAFVRRVTLLQIVEIVILWIRSFVRNRVVPFPDICFVLIVC